MSDIPADIVQLAADLLTDGAQAPIDLEPGAIARHAPGPDGASALVAVLNVDGSRDVCEVALVHWEPSLATENDLIIDTSETELGCALVVQTDLRTSTYTESLDEVLAMAPDDVVAALSDSQEMIDPDRRGLPLKGPLDARWDFKVSEVSRLHRLVQRFIHDLLHDQIREELGISLEDDVIKNLGATETDPHELVEALGGLMVTPGFQLLLQAHQLELLVGLGLDDEASWKKLHPAFGPALFSVLQSQSIGLGSVRRPDGRVPALFGLHEDSDWLVKRS